MGFESSKRIFSVLEKKKQIEVNKFLRTKFANEQTYTIATKFYKTDLNPGSNYLILCIRFHIYFEITP